MTLKGRAVIRAALPGEALLSEEAMASAAALAEALVDPLRGRPLRPVVHGVRRDVFRVPRRRPGLLPSVRRRRAASLWRTAGCA